MNRLKNVSHWIQTDDAERVLLWENDMQFKKVRKSQYMMSQYPTYRNIVIISYRRFPPLMKRKNYIKLCHCPNTWTKLDYCFSVVFVYFFLS